MNGALLIDKPAGVTSHDVVARARRAVKTRSVGHTGTLDPFATGLLILLTGRATRLARFIEQQAKTYLATAKLGCRTTTDDRTGEPVGVEADPGSLTAEVVNAALQAMTGPQLQTPPAYSAKKVGGERSYRLARKGEPVALAPVEVRVDRLELVAYQPPLVTFRSQVSAGTYIRAIARDLGERLGVGAYLESLRREAIGAIRVEAATPLVEWESAPRVTPLTQVLAHLEAVDLTDEEAEDVCHGRPLRRTVMSPGGFVRLMRGQEVAGIGRPDGEWVRPVVVLEGK